MLLLATGAQAAPKRVASFFGGTGSGDGQFSATTGVGGVSVNKTGAGGVGVGDVYVVDRGNNRIQRFSADGAFQAKFGSTGTLGGLFTLPQSVAVDPQNGAVYVLDATNVRIQKFNAKGEFLRAFGGGVVDGGAAGTGSLSNGSTAVSSLVTTSKAFLVGQTVTGTGIEPGTKITAVTATSLTLSQAATTTAAGVSLSVAASPSNVPLNEQQTVTLGANTTGGTFTLTFSGSTTAAIAWNASAATVQGALEALASVGSGNVAVSAANPGGPYTVEFKSRYADTDVAQMTSSATNLVVSSGSKSATIATIVNGASAFETCTVAAECRAGVAGGFGGNFATTFNGQVTVDPSTGSLYVTDPANRRVQQFTPAGAFIRAFGFDVDSANPSTGFEICSRAENCKIAAPASGGEPGRFSNNAPNRVSLAADGTIYALDAGRVVRFTPTGSGLTPAAFAPAFLSNNVSDLAVEPEGGGIFAVRQAAAEATKPCPSGTPSVAEKRVAEFDASGSLLATHMECAGINSVNGIALGAGGTGPAGKLYVTSTTDAQRVYILDGTGATQASATVGAATSVSGHAATLNGSLSRNEASNLLNLQWHFEYSTNGGAWYPSPSADVTISGATTDPIAVSQSTAGLEANQTYLVRLVGTKMYNASLVVSPEGSFTTPPLPVEGVETLPALEITATRAQLNGALNANNEPSTVYWFELVDDASFQATGFDDAIRVPEPAEPAVGGVRQVVSAALDGLEPGSVYHFRVGAENDLGPAVYGAAKEFETAPPQRVDSRGVPVSAGGRAYEMVTPPFKPTRSGGKPGGSIFRNASPGFASPTGDTFFWTFIIFPTSDETAFPYDGDRVAVRRGPNGWQPHTLLTQKPVPGQVLSYKSARLNGASADLDPLAWGSSVELLPDASAEPQLLYTRRDGTGSKGFTSWVPSIADNLNAFGLTSADGDDAVFTDGGATMARWGNYRGLLGSSPAADPSVLQTSGAAGGRTLYLQDDAPEGPLQLVGACTGSGAEATKIPRREGTGVATDTIATTSCGAGTLTSPAGAALGGGLGYGGTYTATKTMATTAMASDGRRLYFVSPDPNATVPTTCSTATGAATFCPPQLFVWDRSGVGGPKVRWISSSRSHAAGGNSYDGAMIADQQVGLMGAGAGFEGASKDGSIMYFKTNAPLTPDDPNGAGVAPPSGGVTTGTASTNSYDLFQYKLPAAGDPGDGKLTRISGGPNGTADPGTIAASGGLMATRFISDDGTKVYFTTTSPIAGADTTEPTNGIVAPGGAAGNAATANLYLFDDTKTGADRYRFITRLPRGSSSTGCALASATARGDLFIMGYNSDTNAIKFVGAKCFRGAPSGNLVAFGSTEQLTSDDNDSAYDIYVYDARVDKLTRITKPPVGVSPYGCEEAQTPAHTASVFCNGDFGFDTGGISLENNRGWAGGRSYNIGEDADGNISVFFESRLSLLPEDRNGNIPGNPDRNYWDVYEWNEGTLELVSPGDTEDDAYFAGSSADGRDVFFTTTKRIDPRELDPADMDTYDARRGGGFQYTPPDPPCDVLAHECRGPATPAPAAPRPSSPEFRGSGNANEKVPPARGKCAKGKTRRNGKCVPVKSKAKKQKKQKKRASKRPGNGVKGAGK